MLESRNTNDMIEDTTRIAKQMKNATRMS